MKADISRFRFDREKSYTAVVAQQGRVQLDSDANEQRAIDAYLRAVGLVDIVGRTGAPRHDAGFAITVPPAGDAIQISAGRFYVDGLLCEALQPADYMQQLWLAGPQPSAAVLLSDLSLGRASAIQVWLEAWQRLVTPIDDPGIKDVALGEADTTDRVQTVWRVVATAAAPVREPRPSRGAVPSCCDLMRQPPAPLAVGSMRAGTDEPSAQSSCLPAPSAAYRGLENQLYRIEVHRGGPIDSATFKWSRENGSVVTRITAVSGPVVTVDNLGPDANLGFAPLDWVEIGDDSDEFGQEPNQPGELRQIQFVDQEHRRITLTAPAPAVDVDNGHAKLRRWDQSDGASADGVAMNPAGPNSLENGIHVQFAADQPFRSGDYWLVPARTATGMVEWPPSDSDGADYQPAHSVRVHRAPLACIHLDAQTQGFRVEDCRDLFSPLTEITPPTVPQALHIDAISWVNDDIMTLDRLLLQGLQLTLDGPPASGIGPGEFIVVLEWPFLPQQEGFSPGLATTGASAGGSTISVLRFPLIIDSAVTIDGDILSWLPGSNAFSYLVQLLDGLTDLANAGQFARARVTLKGRSVRGTAGALFLDGQVFGAPATRQDGTTPRIDLTLPSGNSEKASDFESWFYVAPVPRIASVTVSPANVAFVVVPGTRFLRLVDNSTGAPNPSGPAATPSLTLALNYDALLDTTVTLSVSGPTAGVVTVPPSVTIGRGALSPAQPVPVTVANPGPVTQTFTIIATLNLPGGEHTSNSASITVTGVTPPGPILTGPGGPIGTGPILTGPILTGPILTGTIATHGTIATPGTIAAPGTIG
ncbi:MAG TPA: DUF6519 domain-containing protein [Stellaceae bacterium]|nr:DUF6519 domain-containing protein [Stellaceae bacterium]